jgi:hypothetical protein
MRQRWRRIGDVIGDVSEMVVAVVAVVLLVSRRGLREPPGGRPAR